MAGYVSSHEAGDLVVPVKAATIFAAQENSMFLGGSLIPMVNAPSGFLKVPKLAKASASSLVDGDFTTDVALQGSDLDSSVTVEVDLIAARQIVRDLGSVDANEIGRNLGMSVATKFDTAVYAAMAASGATAQVVGADLSVDEIITAAQAIRANGETGPLFAVINPTIAGTLMSAIGAAAYAGGDFQSQVLRSGYLGSIAGVQIFTSANVGAAPGYVFGADAGRIALQRNVDVEAARRAESVGNDIVASLMAGYGVTDTDRLIKLTAA